MKQSDYEKMDFYVTYCCHGFDSKYPKYVATCDQKSNYELKNENENLHKTKEGFLCETHGKELKK